MPSSPEPLNFTFWGVGVTVEVPTALDGDHLRYYFDDHLDRAAVPASTGTPRAPGGGLRVVLSTSDRSGFVAALGDARVEKLISVDAGVGPVLYERFFAAARRPTPLPPFSLAPLRSTFRLRHAAAACPPSARADAGGSGGATPVAPGGGAGAPADAAMSRQAKSHRDGAVLVTGASGAGKSSLLLGLLQRGWGFVADDIAPVHRAGGRVVRYGRPIGIRSQTLAVHRALGPAVERAGRPIRTASGTTWMTRPEDLGFSLGPVSAPISGEVRVVPADDFRSVARGRSLLLCYRPQCHLERALDALEAWCPDS
jgi:hypothetical protein